MLLASHLTDAERLLIERRRSGLTMAGAAEAWDVSLYRYKLWEAGESDPPRPAIGRLLPHEGALVLRRRAGLSVRALAGEIGVTPWWLSQMEAGQAPPSRLVAYWADIQAV